MRCQSKAYEPYRPYKHHHLTDYSPRCAPRSCVNHGDQTPIHPPRRASTHPQQSPFFLVCTPLFPKPHLHTVSGSFPTVPLHFSLYTANPPSFLVSVTPPPCMRLFSCQPAHGSPSLPTGPPATAHPARSSLQSSTTSSPLTPHPVPPTQPTRLASSRSNLTPQRTWGAASAWTL